MPKRIQRKRTKGWRMPEGAVYVGRPTMFGNPFTGLGAVSCFRKWIELGDLSAYEVFSKYRAAYPKLSISGSGAQLTGYGLLKIIGELRGKDLVCWCPPTRQCHADILLELANREGPGAMP